jgi:nickel transport protein
MIEPGKRARRQTIFHRERLLWRALCVATLALISAPALAHKLQVFAFAEGDRIDGTAYFAGGAKSTGARILIQTANGETVATLTPAADGSFSYRARARADHLVIAESGDGHRAEWRVKADELAGGFPLATSESGLIQTVDMPPSGEAVAVPDTLGAPAPASGATTNVDPALIAAIDRAVARQIRPLREQLIAAQDEIRLRDILGGLGYLFGLTGLALWWHRRRPNTRA